jgi:hypothetical protein
LWRCYVKRSLQLAPLQSCEKLWHGVPRLRLSKQDNSTTDLLLIAMKSTLAVWMSEPNSQCAQFNAQLGEHRGSAADEDELDCLRITRRHKRLQPLSVQMATVAMKANRSSSRPCFVQDDLAWNLTVRCSDPKQQVACQHCWWCSGCGRKDVQQRLAGEHARTRRPRQSLTSPYGSLQVQASTDCGMLVYQPLELN